MFAAVQEKLLCRTVKMQVKKRKLTINSEVEGGTCGLFHAVLSSAGNGPDQIGPEDTGDGQLTGTSVR